MELGLELGVAPERIDTIADLPAAQRLGVKADGNAAGGRPEVMSQLAGLIDQGELELPIAAVYPLERVRDAYADLAGHHARGKIVLVP